MKYFKNADSFFNSKKKKRTIKNPIDQDLQDQEEKLIADEIASRVANAHSNDTSVASIAPSIQ